MFAKQNIMNREELLLKPNWNYHDVMNYIGCQKSKAFQLMKIARDEYGGTIRFNSQCVSRDSILLTLDTNIERETYILNLIRKGGIYGETISKSEVH